MLIVVLGDFNRMASGKFRRYLDALDSSASSSSSPSGSRNEADLFATLEKGIELEGNLETCYHLVSRSFVAIDRVFLGSAPWVVQQFRSEFSTRIDPFESWTKGLSEHAPLQALFSTRPPVAVAAQPVSKYITRTPCFR